MAAFDNIEARAKLYLFLRDKIKKNIQYKEKLTN